MSSLVRASVTTTAMSTRSRRPFKESSAEYQIDLQAMPTNSIQMTLTQRGLGKNGVHLDQGQIDQIHDRFTAYLLSQMPKFTCEKDEVVEHKEKAIQKLIDVLPPQSVGYALLLKNGFIRQSPSPSPTHALSTNAPTNVGFRVSEEVRIDDRGDELQFDLDDVISVSSQSTVLISAPLFPHQEVEEPPSIVPAMCDVDAETALRNPNLRRALYHEDPVTGVLGCCACPQWFLAGTIPLMLALHSRGSHPEVFTQALAIN